MQNLSIKLFIISVVYFDFGCGASEGKAMGGRRSVLGEFPYAVSLQYIDGYHYCSGTLITVSRVLTACHCSLIFTNGFPSKMDPEGSYAIAGDIDRSSFGKNQLRKVEDIKIHDNCSEHEMCWRFDYGLYILAEKFHLTPTLQVANILSMNPTEIKERIMQGQFTTNIMCHAIGWGLQSSGHLGNVSEYLNVVRVKLINFNNCITILSHGGSNECIDNLKQYGHICAVGKGEDVCQGDSGSPLICNKYVYGIVSWGPSCSIRTYPIVYSLVSEVLEWFLESRTISTASSSTIFVSPHIPNLLVLFLTPPIITLGIQ